MRNLFVFLLMFSKLSTEAQIQSKHYEHSFSQIEKMLVQSNYEFKKAVFLIESAYYDNTLDLHIFDRKIKELSKLVESVNQSSSINQYQKDSLNIMSSYAISQLFTDTISVSIDSAEYWFLPFRYSHKDPFGSQDWTNTFVSKLLVTKQGNCRSLAYLYKILAEEVGAEASLALAPNHIYIKQYSEKIGWYNTELTNGSFPTDGWVMASGYVPIEAIRSGIYMKALTEQESIALCVSDLAKGFQVKFKGENPEFILKCCNLSLKYFPTNIHALLLKAETLKSIVEKEMLARGLTQPEQLLSEEKNRNNWEEAESLYLKIYQLGYRPISESMYQVWLGGARE